METNKATRRNYKIYLLVEVESCKIFYVGATTNLTSRLAGHLARAKRGDVRPVYKRIRQILLAKGKVELRGWMRNLTASEAAKAEEDLIRSFGLDNLTNVVGYSAGFNKYATGNRNSILEVEGN